MFSYDRCLRFMSEYSSCLYQGYGVLADPPSKLRTVAKTDNFVILDWNNPKRLGGTVETFHVKFRRLGVGDDYLTVEKACTMAGYSPDCPTNLINFAASAATHSGRPGAGHLLRVLCGIN